MGCIPSRVARKQLETSTIDDALQDDEFVKQILSSRLSLSEKSRQNLLTIAQSTQSQPGERWPTPSPATDPDRYHLLERKDLRAFLTLTEADTSLKISLATEYHQWAVNPESFFCSLDIKSDGGPAAAFLASQARQGRKVSVSRSRLPVDRIRRRFFTLFFFEVDKYSPGKFGNEEWVACGRKYNLLTSILGVGCLFFLPDAISDSVWEERLPVKGGYFEQVISLLKRLRIMEKAAYVYADRVGNAILQQCLLQLLKSENRELTANSSGPRHYVLQTGSVDPMLHLPSEQIFYRVPIVAPYDSPIFVCVQSGDIVGMRDLWRLGLASIDTVDPYGLSLLYYATYYCWRHCGIATALSTCKALLDDGANCAWVDENGNTPMQTMIDILLAESAKNNQSFVSALSCVGQLYARPFDDLWNDYKSSRGFTEIHEVLLRTNHDYGTLDDYLDRVEQMTTVSGLLDANDVSGRSALAWAVEYCYTDAVASLIRFGADVNQRKWSLFGGLPMLHLALAGPASGESGMASLGIVKMLLLAGADVNAVDHEGWTPLHIAASWNSFAGVDTLLKYARTGLNWNALTNSGKSAAQLVVESGGDAALSELLVSHESPKVI